ncbi:hypothetical protein LPY66_06195 [Dehalobacter sp. DCM]|uniref:hypothetical protein n=1 Tax=Dehalobacter sp. DCM TaxID=2907827 RepID=UPI003081350C|nr:hypothetical protein LPY66_06195 [Dehalobacter sp. DCM]
MDSNSLYKEREQNLFDATSFREPKKVPVGMEFVYWPFTYAGVTYKEVEHDPKLTAEKFLKFLDDICLDYIWAGGTLPYPYKAFQALGCDNFYLANDDTTVAHAQVADVYMKDEDYDELIRDPHEFLEETFLKSRIPAFQEERKEDAYAAVKNSMVEFKKFMDTNDLIKQGFNDKSLYTLCNFPLIYTAPLKVIFDKLRGMKDTLIDLRRRPAKVKAACDKMFEQDMAALRITPEDVAKIPGLKVGMTGYHVECFLNGKQFDEYFMEPFLKMYEPYMKAGLKFFLKGEGKFLNTIERYRQTPKGSMIIMLEEDDPFEAHKLIGDWCTLAVGITANLLKYGTKQECIDYVKKCFDTFAPGGGFIFMQDRPLLSAQDAKTENVLAVYEFANDYGKK